MEFVSMFVMNWFELKLGKGVRDVDDDDVDHNRLVNSESSTGMISNENNHF